MVVDLSASHQTVGSDGQDRQQRVEQPVRDQRLAQVDRPDEV